MSQEAKAMKLLMAELRARRWHPIRFEDKSSTGIPDLNFMVPANFSCNWVSYSHSRTFWVEVKDAERKKSGTWSVEFRPAQRAWLIEAQKAGRDVWMVVRYENSWLAIGNDRGWKLMLKVFNPEEIHEPIAYKSTNVKDLIDLMVF